MSKHARYGVTAEHTGRDMFITAHSPCEDPLSLAGEKAAQLHALLSVTRDSVAAGIASDPAPDLQDHLLALAAGLAHETLVLSELAAQHEHETQDQSPSD
ncbi:hypothetical protein ACKI2N_024820 [Cupriavidus sp. 30B13]|uniref:hypothetical protein n=1 Tax=Cupriavidus sp. 30B13 TaxID=3384241 RepID=UPI003B903EDE